MLSTTFVLTVGMVAACSASPEAAPVAASGSASAQAPSPSPSPATPEPSPSAEASPKTEALDVDQMSAKAFEEVQRYRVENSWSEAIEKYGADAAYIASLRSEAPLLLEADPELFSPASEFVVLGKGTCTALSQGSTFEEGWDAISEEAGYVEEEDPMHLFSDFFWAAMLNAVPAYCPEHQDKVDAHQESKG